MKYIDYQERTQQGTFNFPIAFYHQTPHSPRYHMQYHWHTHYELIRIISGTFQLNLENDIKVYYPGAKPGTSPETCSKCGGKGQVVFTQQSFFGTVRNVQACPDCQGTGKVIRDKCPDCHGS